MAQISAATRTHFEQQRESFRVTAEQQRAEAARLNTEAERNDSYVADFDEVLAESTLTP